MMGAAALASTLTLLAQGDMQLRVRRQAGWDAQAREGRCQIRVWIDNRAEVRLRGESIFVRTTEGSKGRDEGSECSQPLPFNSVRNFQIHQTAGRSRIALTEEPSRMNNYTALISINDGQGGGDNYSFEASWQADADVQAAPAPFFDDVRACQEAVRQRFVSQNGRGSYIDFDTFAKRSGDAGRNVGNWRNKAGNGGREAVQGNGTARRANESRELTYSCVVEPRQNQVTSATYQLSGNTLRTNQNRGRQLR